MIIFFSEKLGQDERLIIELEKRHHDKGEEVLQSIDQTTYVTQPIKNVIRLSIYFHDL